MSAAHDSELAAWLDTVEGRACTDIFNLELAESSNLQAFINMRIEKAFAAGWDRCHTQVAAIIADSIGKVLKPPTG